MVQKWSGERPLGGLLVQYGVALTVNLCSMASGVWVSWPSNVIKPLRQGELGFNATQSQVATMVALMDMGNLLTPIPTAYLMDTFGRRNMVQSTAVLFLGASLCAVFSTNIWYLFTAQVLAGMAKGVVYMVVPLFGAEIAEVSIRGALGAMPSITVGVGASIAYVLGPFLTFTNLNIATMILPAVLLVFGFFVPETPYYLVMKGKIKEAEKSLAIYRQTPLQSEKLKAEMELVKRTVKEDMERKTGFKDLFQSKTSRRAVYIIIILSIFQRTAGVGPLMAYGTSRLPEHGGGASREVYAMIFGFLLIFSHNLGMPLVEIVGRKKLTIISGLTVAVVMAVFGAFYHAKNSGLDVTQYNWIPYVCFLLFSLFWGIGLCIIPVIMVGELFSMNVKSYASCIASITYAVSNFSTNKIFGEVPEDSEEIMFYAFSVSCLLCSFYATFFLIETKGKTFLEIQEILGKGVEPTSEQTKL